MGFFVSHFLSLEQIKKLAVERKLQQSNYAGEIFATEFLLFAQNNDELINGANDKQSQANNANDNYSQANNPQNIGAKSQNNDDIYVVDVRTKAEWQFSGTAELGGLNAKLLCFEWVTYPDFAANPHFVEQVTNVIVNKKSAIFFLCKTGIRSYQAANILAEHGYENCFNITHGFEGAHNNNMQRGKVNGWKAEGLPWKQP